MKKILVIASAFLFILSLVTYLNISMENRKVEALNEDLIAEYYINDGELIDEESYIGILEIPAINLNRGFFSQNSINNDVDKNIMLIDGSIMPDEEESLLILAAHRGNASNSYFNNLYKLNIGDEIYVTYKNKKYTYYLKEVYDEEKDGNLSIRRYYDQKELVLITCKKGSKTLQSVYIAINK